jgi:hypothetical protein
MPQVLVVADAPEGEAPRVMFREWVAPQLLDSDHYAGQLLERVRWAAEDAAAAEQQAAGSAPPSN